MSHLPLAGLRVLVTRPEGDGAEEWSATLAEAGAVPVPYPTVSIAPPATWQPLDDALARLASYAWIVFTSQTAVAFVRQRLPDRRFPLGISTKIAAVGAATAAAIEAGGGVVALLPDDSRQEGLMHALRWLAGWHAAAPTHGRRRANPAGGEPALPWLRGRRRDRLPDAASFGSARRARLRRGHLRQSLGAARLPRARGRGLTRRQGRGRHRAHDRRRSFDQRHPSRGGTKPTHRLPNFRHRQVQPQPRRALMSFPENRPRRLRRMKALRRMVRETTLSVDNLMYPLFVCPGQGVRKEIPSLPGQYHLSVDELVREAEAIAKLGIPSVMLFGLPEKKDRWAARLGTPTASFSARFAPSRRPRPSLVVAADCCLCEYTTHGHCGVLLDRQAGAVDNDATLENLARVAVAQAQAGADIVAPSGMMDGTIGFLREALDEAEHEDVILLSYAVKYASAYYGPFRVAADSAPAFGDRRGYQMDPANVREAVREAALDVEEGADIVMVKPALPYLDVVAEIRREFDVPVAAYNVSGEYLMLKAAAEKGFLDYDRAMVETLTLCA